MALRKPVLFTLLKELLDTEFAFRVLGCNTLKAAPKTVVVLACRIGKEGIDLLQIEVILLSNNGLKTEN
jgi:hypothetical protein